MATFITFTCEMCGQEFIKKKGDSKKKNGHYVNRFCSKPCQNKGASLKAKRNRVTLFCSNPNCGREFEKKACTVRKTNFCSLKCLFSSRAILKNTPKKRNILRER